MCVQHAPQLSQFNTGSGLVIAFPCGYRVSSNGRLTASPTVSPRNLPAELKIRRAPTATRRRIISLHLRRPLRPATILHWHLHLAHSCRCQRSGYSCSALRREPIHRGMYDIAEARYGFACMTYNRSYQQNRRSDGTSSRTESALSFLVYIGSWPFNHQALWPDWRLHPSIEHGGRHCMPNPP